jgi:hypothetical protein
MSSFCRIWARWVSTVVGLIFSSARINPPLRVPADYLVQVGIPSAQLNVVSYGKGNDHDEACWQRNRRVHIVALAQAH